MNYGDTPRDPKYREAIEWIALNDGPGDSTAFNPKEVGGQVTCVMVAHLFGVSNEKVGNAVVYLRRKLRREGRF
jgi:hypothetical protein